MLDYDYRSGSLPPEFSGSYSEGGREDGGCSVGCIILAVIAFLIIILALVLLTIYFPGFCEGAVKVFWGIVIVMVVAAIMSRLAGIH